MRSLITAALIFSASLGAQQPTARQLTEGLLVPIHSTEEAGYGIWAAGNNYKVGFAGDFCFVPYLGSDYAVNMPFGWHTESVRIGVAELATQPKVATRTGDHRFEYHHGGVIEAYDVSSASVEQTFLIPKRPRQGGDLVIIGRITSPLHARPRAAAHASIQFLDAEHKSIVEYGAATAIDATGNPLPMTSSWDGETIQLRLDAATVDRVSFPLLIDPVILSTASSQNVGMVTIATNSSPWRQVCFTRITSRGDHDAYGLRYTDDWSKRYLVFNDASSSYSTNHIAVVRSASRFLIAYERRYSNKTDLRMFWQSPGVTALNSGASRVLPAVSGEHLRSPSLGSGYFTSYALLAYDRVGAGTSTVRGGRLFTGSAPYTYTALPVLATPGVQVGPSVSPMSGDIQWIVCWAQTSSTVSHIRFRGVDRAGVVTPTTVLRRSTSSIYSQARVAGSNGRFMLTYRRGPRSLGTHSIIATRFDYKSSSTTVLFERTIRSGQSYSNGGLAFDRDSSSHWMAGYTVFNRFARHVEYARLGFNAQASIVSTPQLSDRPFTAAVAFAKLKGGHGEFVTAYGTDGTNNAVIGNDMPYSSAAAKPKVYGTDCGGVTELAGFGGPSLAGDEFFYMRLHAKTPVPALLLIGLQSVNTPLDAMGMPTCFLHVDSLLSIYGALNPTRDRTQVTLPLPADPRAVGATLYMQWLWVSPNANPLGVLSSSGVQVFVR